MNNNKMAAKMAACSFLNLHFYHLSSSKFHTCISFIKLFPKIICGYYPMNDNQDCHKYGHCLSVCMCGHSNLVIYQSISSKFHIWTTFTKLLFMSEYGFWPTNDNQDGGQNRYPLFTAGHYAGPFIGVGLF